jgi:tRNA (guanine37-N1)-methyltransferase
VDERVAEHLVDEELSLGSFVLTGGELAAMIVVDAVTRLLPGVLGNEESARDESFSDGETVEFPQYTKPETYRGWAVPSVLLSGHHAEIAAWRQAQSQHQTKQRYETAISVVPLPE